MSFVSIFLFTFSLHAQIKKVFIETYYISDSTDATDTTGGILPIGSITYRVFIYLTKGNKLLSIYGDENHTLKFGSDSVFFNNKAGQTFAFNIAKNQYRKNTLALDTWLTLGQVSTTGLSSGTYFGVPKTSDFSGSIVNGIPVNDGGSAKIKGGLLTNKNPSAGIPLTVADGMDTMSRVPTYFSATGILQNILLLGQSYPDSTIFGSIVPGKNFDSNIYGPCSLSCSGVMGVNPDSNQVLVAQLTTKAIPTFELNVEVADSNGEITKYVASENGNLADDERVSPFLTYPLLHGCMDDNFLEYSSRYGINDSTQCKTPIIFGCMDSQACNFEPKANVSLKSLCCYPGYCNDRDLSIVCPALLENTEMFVYPNPASSTVTLKIEAVKNKNVSYTITNETGTTVLQKDLGTISQTVFETITISKFKNGVYNCQISIGNTSQTKTFVKQ